MTCLFLTLVSVMAAWYAQVIFIIQAERMTGTEYLARYPNTSSFLLKMGTCDTDGAGVSVSKHWKHCASSCECGSAQPCGRSAQVSAQTTMEVFDLNAAWSAINTPYGSLWNTGLRKKLTIVEPSYVPFSKIESMFCFGFFFQKRRKCGVECVGQENRLWC